MLSNRSNQLKSSATLSLKAKAKRLEKLGKPVISFATGEPDFLIPKHVKEAGLKALEQNKCRYTSASGIPELKEALCEKLISENQIQSEPENIIVTSGGKQALANFFLAHLNPGDEVLIPSPFWVSYDAQIELAEGVPVFLKTESPFKISADQIAAQITPKTKAVVLNSPSNPTGAVIDEIELRKIAEIAIENNLFIVSDEVYEYFIFDDAKHFSIASIPEIKDQVITINAFSKAYSMTGLRIGYACGPKNIISAMTKLQGHQTSNANSVAQYMALSALREKELSKQYLSKMIQAFNERREYLFKEINSIHGLQMKKPHGAFYAFPNISGILNESIKNSADFSNYLLENYYIAVVPGSAFGSAGENHFRMSYAASIEEINEGLSRIKNSIQRLI